MAHKYIYFYKSPDFMFRVVDNRGIMGDYFLFSRFNDVFMGEEFVDSVPIYLLE